MRNNILYLSLLTLLIGSCATYQAKPLNDEEINKALEKPFIESDGQVNKLKPKSIDLNKPLTAQQLAILAVITSPELKAVRSKRNIASAQVFDAGLLPDPQFMPGYEIPTTTGYGVSPAYSFWLTWDIGSLVTRSLKESAALENKKQVNYDIAWQEWMVANQVELLATRLSYLQKQDEIIKKVVKINREYLNKSQVNLELHNLKSDDFGQQKSTYLDLLDQQQSLERLLAKTNLELLQIVGLPPSASIKLTISSKVTIPDTAESQLFDYAKQHRLDILALKAGYNNQEIQVRQAILGQYPHFNMSLYPGQDNTSNGYFGVNVSFDIPVFNRNRGAIAIATATRENLYLEYLARLHSVRADIFSISKEFRWAGTQKLTLESEIYDLRKTENSLNEELSRSNLTITAYINFYNTLYQKEIRLLSLQQDLAEQKVALQMNVGKYLDENNNEIK